MHFREEVMLYALIAIQFSHLVVSIIESLE